MLRVEASPVPAQVVDMKALWYRTHILLVRDPMNLKYSIGYPDSPVTIYSTTEPLPAACGRVYRSAKLEPLNDACADQTLGLSVAVIAA